jgi:hypothetical protein
MSTKKPPYEEVPIRVYMEDGTLHVLRRIGLSVAAAEHPDAVRIERADKRQPPQIAEDSNDG